MKTFITICFLCGIFTLTVFSQTGEHSGGSFTKKVEYNLMPGGEYNIAGKGSLFSDFNAPIEFSFNPSFEYNPCIPSDFRMVRDTVKKSHTLEIKYITDYRETWQEIRKKAKENRNRHLIDLPAKVLDSLPRTVFNMIWEYNQKQTVDMYYEKPFPYKVESLSFAISAQFAEQLYEKTVAFINNFKAKGAHWLIVDGYSVTFRAVVDDEVWSLDIHMPEGDARRMADLCRQIIADAIAGKLDEAGYIAKLSTF